MDEFVASWRPTKIILLMLASLIFVAIGVWMTGLLAILFASSGTMFDVSPNHSSRIPEWSIKPLGWVGVIFGGVAAIVLSKRLFSKQYYMRIDATGISVPSIIDRPISWSEISRITTWSSHRQKAIVFKLHDPSILRSPTWRKVLDNMNRRLTGGDMAVSMIGTNRTFDQATEAIEFFSPQNLR